MVDGPAVMHAHATVNVKPKFMSMNEERKKFLKNRPAHMFCLINDVREEVFKAIAEILQDCENKKHVLESACYVRDGKLVSSVEYDKPEIKVRASGEMYYFTELSTEDVASVLSILVRELL